MGGSAGGSGVAGRGQSVRCGHAQPAAGRWRAAVLGLRVLRRALVLVFRRAAGGAAVRALSAGHGADAAVGRGRAGADVRRAGVRVSADDPADPAYRAAHLAGRHVDGDRVRAGGVECAVSVVPHQFLLDPLRRLAAAVHAGVVAVAGGLDASPSSSTARRRAVEAGASGRWGAVHRREPGVPPHVRAGGAAGGSRCSGRS